VIDYTVMMLYKEIGNMYFYSDHYLTLLGSALSLVNALFRIFWGMMAQIYDFKKLLMFALGGQVLR
jgi:MFS family permease